MGFPWFRPFEPMFTRMRTAYPVTRRGGPVMAHRALNSAVMAIEERGQPDAELWLLSRIEAYARSWKVRTTEEQYLPMLATWLDAGSYDCDDAEWDDPKAIRERDTATRRDIALWKQDPENARWAIAAGKLTPEIRERRRQDWLRLGGTEGPWGTTQLRIAT